MDRIDAMRAFVAAVDRGSLSAAGRQLGHSTAAVSRAIAALEVRLGARLLHRSTRALHLTSFGKTYLATCRDVLAALDEAERGAAPEQAQPRGLLTITAPLRFGQLHVRPVLDAFLDAQPGVRARRLLLDGIANLVEEGIDIAVRLAHLPASGLLAIRIGCVLCAAPAYLKRSGVPHEPASLRDHACIMESHHAETGPWRFAQPGQPPPPGRETPVSLAIRPRLVVNSASAAVDSAVAGHGVVRALSYQVAAEEAAGRLVVLLAGHEPPPVPVHLVMPPTRTATARQPAFVAFAAPRLRQLLTTAARDVEAAATAPAARPARRTA